MGVPIIDPKTPPLLMVKVPPAISSIVILPNFPLLAKPIKSFSTYANPLDSTFLMTGTMSPLGVATATLTST